MASGPQAADGVRPVADDRQQAAAPPRGKQSVAGGQGHPTIDVARVASCRCLPADGVRPGAGGRRRMANDVPPTVGSRRRSAGAGDRRRPANGVQRTASRWRRTTDGGRPTTGSPRRWVGGGPPTGSLRQSASGVPPGFARRGRRPARRGSASGVRPAASGECRLPPHGTARPPNQPVAAPRPRPVWSGQWPCGPASGGCAGCGHGGKVHCERAGGRRPGGTGNAGEVAGAAWRS
ncbi:hypothetical protein HMPREF1211_02811 [Streptomyces sp. HGB0020]|nr:hypothetical protein HMPREF1211_02811 [Streptomyces sp. HGB0020]